MIRTHEPKLNRKVIRRVIEALILTYDYTLEELDTFARIVNSIYRYGYLTDDGNRAYVEIMYGVPTVQDLRLDILSTMYEQFLLEGITLQDLSNHIMNLYIPMHSDNLIEQAYSTSSDINIIKSNDYIATFGSNFILFLIFKTLTVELLKETSKIIQLRQDEADDIAEQQEQLQIKKKIMELENEES